MSTTAAQNWRHFPRYLMLALGVVVAVNVKFIVSAVVTFPGAATNDDFDASNRYNEVMQAVESQNALGWTERAGAQGRVPVIDLTTVNHPLEHATLTVQAERPLGNLPAITINLHETTPGHFVADAPLPAPGQWDLKLTVNQPPHSARVTRRIVVN